MGVIGGQSKRQRAEIEGEATTTRGAGMGGVRGGDAGVDRNLEVG